MKFCWTVEDGYVGKSRPQYTTIPDYELAECATEEERMNLIDRYIEDDFGQRITWCRVPENDRS